MKSLYSLVALTATFTTLPAADITWTGATNTWNTAANWSGTNTPPLSGDNLIFGAPGAGGAALNNDLTNSSFQIGTLSFLNTATTGYTIGNGVDNTVDTSAFTLTGSIVNNSTTTHTINSAITLSGATIANITGGNVTLRGTLSGSGTLEKTGAGILRLGGPNSTVNTGTITVTAGTLELNKAPNLNQISSNIITNGGTLTWTAGTTNQANQIADTATITIQGGTGNTGGIGSVVTDTVAAVTSFGNQSRFNLGSGSNFTITGALSLTGSNGAGNANSYSLAANSAASTLTVGSINLDNAFYQIGQTNGANNATLNLNGSVTGANTSSINNTTGGAGIRSFVLTGAGTHDHVFNITSGTTTVSANISQTAATTGSLTKATGTGTLVLTGANTYSGGTNINAGTLQAGNASALGTGTVNIGGGNLSTTIANLGTGTLALTSGAFSLNGTAAGTLTLSADSDFTMSGGQWIVALTASDQILGSGAGANFLITGGTLDLGGGAINYGTTYNLLTGFATGSVSGLAITNYDTSNFTANLGSNGVLSFIAVPEPATALLGGLGLLGLLRRRRA